MARSSVAPTRPPQGLLIRRSAPPSPNGKRDSPPRAARPHAARPRRSAIHILMSVWRVTPRRRASRSSASTTQPGKSTLTRRTSRPGRRDLDQSTNSAMSSPSSNLASNALALIYFIPFNLILARATNRNDPDALAAPRENRRPDSASDPADRQEPRLRAHPSRREQAVRIVPQLLRLAKIDSVPPGLAVGGPAPHCLPTLYITFVILYWNDYSVLDYIWNICYKTVRPR